MEPIAAGAVVVSGNAATLYHPPTTTIAPMAAHVATILLDDITASLEINNMRWNR
jgi:hypothetical protein